MTDQEKVTLAFDMLEDADVVQVFDDEVWVKLDREMWNEFNGITDVEEEDEKDEEDEQPIVVDFPPQCTTPYMNGDIEC